MLKFLEEKEKFIINILKGTKTSTTYKRGSNYTQNQYYRGGPLEIQ